VDSMVQQPVNYDVAQVDRIGDALSLSELKKDEQLSVSSLTLKPKQMKTGRAVAWKVLALLALLWTLMVLATEATLIFDPRYTLPNFLVNQKPKQTISTFIISVFFLSGITMCSFFSIFNLKISDYLQLKKEQTDCIQMASITGLCATIVNVIVYNYMVICGEI
jgi:hypothetical protein